MPNVCLIVEPIPLVAKDLVATARENLGCEALVAASEAEALSLIEGLDGPNAIELAFIHQTVTGFDASMLRPVLERRGVKVILLGPDPGSDWPSGGWPALVWPFSTDQVLALIESLQAAPRDPVSG